MKKFNRILSVLLCAMVMLMGISSNGVAASAEEGVYVETIMPLPAGYQSITALSPAAGGGVYAAAQKEGGTAWDLLFWSAMNAEPVVLPLALEGGSIASISVAPDGQIAALLGLTIPGGARMAVGADENQAAAPPAGEGNMPKGEVENSGGPVMKQSISIGDISNTVVWFDQTGAETARYELTGMLSDLVALDGRQAAGLDQLSGILIVDENGKTVTQIPGNDILSITAVDGVIYALTMEAVIAYRADTGSKISSTALSVAYAAQIVAYNNDTLFIMDQNGLYRLSMQTGEMTQLLGAIGNLFGDPSNAITGLAAMADGSVIALYEEGTGSFGGRTVMTRIGGETSFLLAEYRYTTDSVGAKTDFTITALYDSAKLRKAANDFQRLHPELSVRLQTQLAEGDTSPVDDYVRTINTDLLAGKGGDVLILDGLPLDRYAQRGYLADLSQIMQDIDLLPGIWEGSKDASGRIYAIPAQFSFELLWGDKAIVSAIESLDSLSAIPLKDGQTLFNPRTPENWIRLFYSASAPLFTGQDGKPDFESPQFIDFLEALYTLYANQGDAPTDNTDIMGGIEQADLVAVINGVAALYPQTTGSLMNLSIAYTIAGGENSAFALVPTVGAEGLGYTPSLLAGINAQSANQQLAEEFIRYLFSEEIQQMEQMNGLPTSSSSLDALFNEAIERSRDTGKFTAMFAMSGMNPIEMRQPTEATLLTLRALCDTLSTPIYAEEKLMSFIIEETEAFFAGNVSAQDAARAVKQRAWSYLNE